jgi:hypothetical protein
MSNLDRIQPARTVVVRPTTGATLAERRQAGRTTRALAVVEHTTLVRLARVQAESIVQTEKLCEIDHLSREAMTGHALLHRWATTLASGDPFIVEDLKFFLDTAKLGKGEVIADTIDSYCRESRS